MAKARKSSNSSEPALSVPVIGSIPRLAPLDGEGISAFAKKSTDDIPRRFYEGAVCSPGDGEEISLAYSRLAESVIREVGGGVLAVSSFIPAEGKSTLCANLANTLGASGKQVLLLECDMRLPSLSKIFGIKGDRGLSDILTSHTEYSDSLILTPEGCYTDLVLCGKIPGEHRALLTSEVMKDLISHLRARYDYVIIDTPPVSEISDALDISYLVDAYILPVRVGYSDINCTERAADMIRKSGGAVLGVVILGSEEM